MSPRVSIGLPVQNGQRFLREAIHSILNQTYQDFELIISDNASTDQTHQICEAYAQKDKRIRFYRQPTNVGSAGNFNTVFRLSRGEYFKWAAADDVLEPTFIERCVDVLDADPEVVLAYPRAIIIDEFKKVFRQGTFRYELVDLRTPKPHERFRQMFHHVSIYPIFGLIRSRVLRRTRLFRPHIGADNCLLVSLVLLGKFGEVPEYLLRLRAHGDGYTCKITRTLREGGMEGKREAKWWNPHHRGNVVMPYWRRLREHFLSVLRSDVSLREKVAMVAFLCRVANWWRGRLGREVLSALT
jgi:glycosyltransferase involved in cell wall biosynthesis